MAAMLSGCLRTKRPTARLHRFVGMCLYYNSAHSTHIQKRTHTHAHGGTVCGCHKIRYSQRSYCCTVNATSAEPGGPCEMQQQSSRATTRKRGFICVFAAADCFVLRKTPGMRSKHVLGHQHQTVDSRRRQSQQQPVAVSSSYSRRKSSSSFRLL